MKQVPCPGPTCRGTGTAVHWPRDRILLCGRCGGMLYLHDTGARPMPTVICHRCAGRIRLNTDGTVPLHWLPADPRAVREPCATSHQPWRGPAPMDSTTHG